MKLISLLFIILLRFDGTTASLVKESSDKNTVYVCGSGKGKRYHLNENCRGLMSCSAKTIKTTREQAQKEGKTLCGWED